MAAPAFKHEEIFTYADYLKWDTEERFELYSGIPVMMSPAPKSEHQKITLNIASELRALFKGKESPCQVFVAPYDVVLPEENESENSATNVVQPDVLVVCDKNKITPRNCLGAPDLAVEVLSPSTALNDQKYKYELYQKHGVKEYWIADPEAGFLIRYILDDAGKYQRDGVYAHGDMLPLFFLEEMMLDLSQVFESKEEELSSSSPV